MPIEKADFNKMLLLFSINIIVIHLEYFSDFNPTTGGMDSGILSADDFTTGIFSSSTSCSSTGSNVTSAGNNGQQMAATSSMMPPPPPPPLPAAASAVTTTGGLDFDIDFIDQVISRTPLSSNSGDDVSMEPLASDVAGFLNSIEPPSGVGNSNSNTIYSPSTSTTNHHLNANQVNNNSINNLNFDTPPPPPATSIGDVLGGEEADMMLTSFGGVPCWETAGTL